MQVLMFTNALLWFLLPLTIVLGATNIDDREMRKFWFWLAAVELPLPLIHVFVGALGEIRTIRYDLYLNAIDSAFNYPANAVGALFNQFAFLRQICLADYILWWIPAMITLLLVSKSDLREAKIGFVSLLLAGFVSLPIYLLVPASGPGFAFSQFPDIYSGAVYTVASTSPPNCLPSVHFTIALINLWFGRRFRTTYILGIFHVALTASATLGLGEHYFIDLLAAVPFTWFVIRFAENINSLHAPRLGEKCIPAASEL